MATSAVHGERQVSNDVREGYNSDTIMCTLE